MIRRLLGAALAAGAAACAKTSGEAAAYENPVTEYIGGRVFDGERFVERALYVSEGSFVAEPPREAVAETIDLAGLYVTPPFSDAHNHVTAPIKMASDYFMKQGVFYVVNPTTIVGPFKGKLDFFDRPETYDVVVSMGGITAPGGHPEKLYVDVLTKFAYPGRTRESFIGDAFHYVTSEAEIAPVLDRLTSQGAEIVKTYLLSSEEFETRNGNPDYYGNTGLDPALYPKIVSAIHDRGLRAFVHVESDYDARVAAEAGVDWLAHLPAYGASSDEAELAAASLSDATVEAIVAADMIVTPTYLLSATRYARSDADDPRLQMRDATEATQRANLKKLKAANVRFAIGTDGAGPPQAEAENLVRLGAFTRAEALRLLTGTAALIYPERDVSCFDPGCEASFLAFDADPLAAPLTAATPVRYLKQGVALSFPGKAAEGGAADDAE